MAAEVLGSGFSLSAGAGVLRRNLALIAICTLFGAILGLVAASVNPTYSATTLLGVRVDGGDTSTASETAAKAVVSPAVIRSAAKALGITEGELSSNTSATVESGTTLIELTSASTSSETAVRYVTKVAEQAVADFRARSDAIAADVRQAGEELLAKGKLSEGTAERTRQESIGTVVGSAQGQSIQGSVTITIVSPATQAGISGVSKPIGLVLGAAAGFLIGTLSGLSGLLRGRRRVRYTSDLAAAVGVHAALDAAATGQLAGLAMNRARAIVLVSGPEAALRALVSSRLAGALDANGFAVGAITVDDGERKTSSLARDHVALGREGTGRGGKRDGDEDPADSWTLGVDRLSEVLSKSKRAGLPQELGVDYVVIDLPSVADAETYLAGQADFFAVLAIPKGTRISTVEGESVLVRPSEPVGVLGE